MIGPQAVSAEEREVGMGHIKVPQGFQLLRFSHFKKVVLFWLISESWKELCFGKCFPPPSILIAKEEEFLEIFASVFPQCPCCISDLISFHFQMLS